MDLGKVVQKVLEEYVLPVGGLHGVSHWARVLENGRELARHTGARIEVVELFAVLHDSKRMNEGRDERHGFRAAESLSLLRGAAFDLSDDSLALLFRACAYHTDGLTEEEITVQTCWDSDRLDLPRAGITPDPARLCTEAARDIDLLRQSHWKSESRYVPALVFKDWGIRVSG